jgi:hypothetical protein
MTMLLAGTTEWRMQVLNKNGRIQTRRPKILRYANKRLVTELGELII